MKGEEITAAQGDDPQPGPQPSGEVPGADALPTQDHAAIKQRIAGLSARQRAALRSRLGRVDAAPASPADPAGHIPRARPLRVETEPPVTVHPASRGQQRMWFLQHFAPESPAYNVPSAFHLDGPLDVSLLEAALGAVIQRHDILHTTFAEEGGGLTQRVAPAGAFQINHLSLETVPAAARTATAERLINEEASRPFQLADGPPFRVVLIRLHPAEHVLLVVMHHIISDGWSRANFYRDLSTAGQALGAGRPAFDHGLPVQFADYSAWREGWLNAGPLAAQTAYWMEKLAGEPAPVELPADRARPALETFRGGQCRRRLEAGLVSSLKARAQDEGATLFMILLAAFKALLHRYTGREDLLVGVPIANRPRVEAEGLIGFFANTLVLRTGCPGGLTFRELLRRVKETTVDAYANQDMPFERLVELLHVRRDTSRTPLFQTSFALRDFPAAELTLPGVQATSWPVTTHTSKFDLSLTVEQSAGEWTVLAEYSTDLFDEWRVQRLLAHWEVVLDGVAANPDQQVAELPLLTPDERHQVLVEWNRTERSYPQDQCVHQLFEEQVRRTPDAVAVVFEDQELTYAGLNARANQLARQLMSLGVGTGSLTGLYLERSPELIIGVLGILKAGGAYVPLDTDWPMERTRLVMEDAGLAAVVTRRAHAERLQAGRPALVLIDGLPNEHDPAARLNPAIGVSPTDLVYLLYTSGTTGRPKGVLIEHRQLLHYVFAIAERLDLRADGTYAMLQPLTFDSCQTMLFPALCRGGTLHLVSEPLALDAAGLAELFRRRRIDYLKITPSHLAALVEALPSADLLPERALIMGGEALRWDFTDRLWSLTPRCKIWNHYGPTETTVGVSVFPVRRPDERTSRTVPIGRPLPNIRHYILDQRLQPVPVGVPGELCIGGSQVGRGYLNHPELSAERFVPDPRGGTPGGRMYRTGDRARHLVDGNVEFLGREDGQVKIRGFRIELGEIEAALRAAPLVSEAAVAVLDAGARGARLVACLVMAGNATLNEPALKQSLRSRLPGHMIPEQFVPLAALPLTPHGKLDRLALAREIASRLTTPAGLTPPMAEPLGGTEQVLADMWREVLGVERVGRQDNFFQLGGHSLLAMQVVARMRGTFGRNVPVSSLLTHPTLAAFAAVVDGTVAPEMSTISPRDSGGPDPLSAEQFRQLFLWHALPNPAAYNGSSAWRLSGLPAGTNLRAAWAVLVNRHEQLRTRFIEAAGEPAQAYLSTDDAVRAGWSEMDLTNLPRDEREHELRHHLDREVRRPFDLTVGPLWRLGWFRLREGEAVLLLTFHHAISDDWSIRLLFHELSALLAGRELPEPPSLRYADYARWQQANAQAPGHAADAEFWRGELTGTLGAPALPADFPRTTPPTHAGTRCVRKCPAEVRARLLAVARETGATGFAAGLAAFQIFLARWTRQRDFIVGTPLSQRSLPGSEAVVGMFLNTIPLRARIAPETSFREFLRATQAALNRGIAHGNLPFDQIVQLARAGRSAGAGLARVLFVQLETGRPRLELEGVSVEPVDCDSGAAKADLTAYLRPEADGSWEVSLVLSRDLFAAPTAERVTGGFVELLGQLAAEPDVSLAGTLGLTGGESPPERPSPGYPRDASLTSLFSAVVERHAEREALVAGQQRWSYRALDDAAERMARALRELGVGRGSRVALHLPRSPEFVIALLGVLKAGAAYVPLATDLPAARLRFLIKDVAPLVVVAMTDAAAPWAAGVVWLSFEAALERPPARSAPVLESGNESLDPACILFTSGSTGEPKGVVVPHRAIIRLVMGQDYLPFGPEQRFLLLAPIAFDASTLEIWGPLLHGGACVVFPGEHPEPDLLGSVLRDERITSLWLTAGLFNQLVDLKPDLLRPVRHLLTGGEALSLPHVRRALVALPDTVLINGYGPTESTTFTTTWTVPRDGSLDQLDSVPIGRPLTGTVCRVLNDQQRPVGVGEAGELCVGGDGLALGYFQRPELTAGKFIDDPAGQQPGARLYRTGDRVRWREDGTLEFLGRLDNQVKIRGFRVEPGEIEAALLQHPEIAQAAVVARTSAAGSRQLVAVVVPANGARVTSAALRTHLSERVPAQLIPARFEVRPVLPLTLNGKTDRQTLETEIGTEPEAGFAESAPVTEAEIRLARLWGDILGVNRVSRQDSFFELGGHSLAALRLMILLRERFGKRLSLASLFLRPRLDQMAADLAGEEVATTGEPASAFKGARTGTPFFLIPGMFGFEFMTPSLAAAIGRSWPYFDGLEYPGLDGSSPPSTHLPEIAGHLARQIEAVCPEGPLALGGHSLGGVTAYEVARQLSARGRTVQHLILWDSTLPRGRRRRSPWETLQVMLARARRMPPDEGRKFLARLFWQKALQVRSKLARSTGVPLLEPQDSRPAHVRALQEASGVARERYLPEPYSGRVTLIQATEPVPNSSLRWAPPSDNGWSGLLLGPTRIVRIACMHHETCREPVHPAVLTETVRALSEPVP